MDVPAGRKKHFPIFDPQWPLRIRQNIPKCKSECQGLIRFDRRVSLWKSLYRGMQHHKEISQIDANLICELVAFLGIKATTWPVGGSVWIEWFFTWRFMWQISEEKFGGNHKRGFQRKKFRIQPYRGENICKLVYMYIPGGKSLQNKFVSRLSDE